MDPGGSDGVTVVPDRGLQQNSDNSPTAVRQCLTDSDSPTVRQSDSVRQRPTVSDSSNTPSLSKPVRQLQHNSDRCPTDVRQCPTSDSPTSLRQCPTFVRQCPTASGSPTARAQAQNLTPTPQGCMWTRRSARHNGLFFLVKPSSYSRSTYTDGRGDDGENTKAEAGG